MPMFKFLHDEPQMIVYCKDNILTQNSRVTLIKILGKDILRKVGETYYPINIHKYVKMTEKEEEMLEMELL